MEENGIPSVTEKFHSFIEICSGRLIADIADNASECLIFDNPHFHRNIENIEVDVMNSKRLSRYSPFLIPAENAVSTWKSSFKTLLNARQNRFINITGDRRAGQFLADYRFRLI